MDGDSGSVGGAGGAGGASGAGAAGGAGPAGDAGESKGATAGDRSDVSAAADAASAADVGAQADSVTGKDDAEDSFDRAATPSTPASATTPAGDVAAATTPAAAGTTPVSATATPATGTPAAPEDAPAAQPATTATPHNIPSEGTLAERSRRESAAVEALADRLAASSPTAAGLLADFRAAGGTFQHSYGGGMFNRNPGGSPTIGVPAGTDAQRMQTIAHELGHFDYRNNPDASYVQPGRPAGLTDHQIEQRRERDYIVENTNRRLADEGNAAIINNAIRNELRAATGIDIGVAGDIPGRPMPFNSAAPIADQRRAIGDYFGSHLTTSTTGENYRSYYGQTYIDHYRDNFMPGSGR